ncbi:MAG: hypothetical protein MJ211_09600 [Bacteroidales bacterium]|nr:hypothetical protein [Bacteroidales bacterium]
MKNEFNFLNKLKIDELKITAPICIPTYKNRAEKSKTCIIRKLDALKDAEIYLFLYEDDYIASGYDKLDLNKPNIHLVFLNVDENSTDVNLEKNTIPGRSVRYKRKFMQMYMEKMNIDLYFMLDDDLDVVGKISCADPNDERQSKQISLYETLAVWEWQHRQENWCLSTVNNPLGTCNPDKPYVSDQIVIQTYLINGKWFKEHNVYFQSRDDLNNDVIFSIDTLRAGGSPHKINYLATFLVFTDGNNSLMSNLQRHKKSTIGSFLYCNGAMKFMYHQDKDLQLTLQKVYPDTWKEFYNYKKIIDDVLNSGGTPNDAYDECLKTIKPPESGLNDFFEML